MLLSSISIEERIPGKHPLRQIRLLDHEALKRLDSSFEKLYACSGCPSIPPEHLLPSLLLQAVYTLRSQRLPLEQLHDNLLHRWFVGLGANDHFPADGTLLHTCASHGSLQPVDGQHDDGQDASPSPSPPCQAGNGWGKADTDAQRRGEKGARQEVHGRRFSNLTHRSTYDPDAYPNSG